MLLKRLAAATLSLLLVLCAGGCDYHASGGPPTDPSQVNPTANTGQTNPTIPTNTEGTAVPSQPGDTTPPTGPTETIPVVTTPQVTVPSVTEEGGGSSNTEATVPPTETTVPPQTTAPPVTQPPATEPQVTEPQVTEPPAPTEHTHSYTDSVVQATCSAEGYTVHRCSCGHSYTDNATSALGHLWGDWSVEKAATYTEEGREIRYCSRCWETETNPIPVLVAAPELWTPASEKEAEIARLFLEYINQFRAEEGSTQLTYLPGMSQVAQYRSRQLVTNLAHDTADKREALAYYKYGTFKTPGGWDPSEYYYEAETQEAIGKTNLIGTSEQVAFELASAFRNSPGHWRYVGSSANTYTGIGIACVEGETYVCIMVGDVNYG